MFALRLAGRRAVRVTAAFPRHTAVRPMSSATGDMFCFQCEQTEGGTGCTTVGVCGKTATTAGLQDVLVHSIKGLAVVADDARKAGLPEDDEVNDFTTGALFSTLTNVNFDADRFAGEYIPKANELISRTRARYEQACAEQGKTPSSVENTAAAAAVTLPSQADELLALDSEPYSVTARRASLGDEAAMMQELVMYGLKGTAAYLHHANVFKQSPELHASLQETLAVLGRNVDDFDTLLGAALGVGALNFEVLKLLDEGHTERFGHPVPTPVTLKPKTGKCILVSGHDMADLDDLLNQVKGTDISVYTHGEMLPAHGYPNLHKHENLAGHLFGAWQMQRFEFTKFPGPILVTSNCIVEPRSSYQDRVYTTNAVGWPGLKHVTSNPDGSKDYSALIEQAMAEPGFTEKAASKFPEKSVTVGFGHNTVLGVADQVIDAVKAGKLNHIFFIGGCDGAEGERSYFKELAQSTPSDSLILTAGCGKYRFNRLELGTLGDTGLPRVLDMGQCNDSYSAIVTAVALAKAFDTDVNGLPLSFAVSWFEQKAVAVLLTLLHLGVKNIHLGPNLPAFVTPKLLNALVDNYGLAPIGTAQGDLDKFLAK